mmetsp:Transcript_3320/g.9195  ORF Transcript_3320/g.9195 Transcript_3320/m.9195 type:complete len:148 (-) Transcript_3320:190-633(-)
MTTINFKRLFAFLVSLSLFANVCFGFAPVTRNSVNIRHAPNSIPRSGRTSVVFDDSKPTVALAVTPDVEAELLTTMAHATMDFSAFFGPSERLIRLYSVVGRVFVISADYVSDNSIRPEELAIQLLLMGIAVRELIVDAPANSNQAK